MSGNKMIYKLAENKLLSGFIYGDTYTGEYIYLPASELDSHPPIAVYEHDDTRDDVSLQVALQIIEKRSLRLVSHPVFGARTI